MTAGLEVLWRRPPSPSRAPVLFVHGARHAAWCWQEHFLDYFAHHGRPAAALSLRGHGRSPGRTLLNTYHLTDYAHDLEQVLTELPEPPILVGHSMGGAVVQLLLARHPTAARAAVLMASVPPDGIRPEDDTGKDPGHDRIRRQLQDHQAEPDRHSFPWQALFSPTLEPGRRTRYLRQLQPESPLIQPEIRRELVPDPERVRLPLLTLGAECDWFLPPSAVIRTSRSYQSPCVIFPGMAHDMMLEPKWKQVADQILAFAEKILDQQAPQPPLRLRKSDDPP